MYDLEAFKKTELGKEIEHQIRYTLGQRLEGSKHENDFELRRVNHLRFEMSGYSGHEENKAIFDLFDFPVTYIALFSKDIPESKINYKEYQFGFYKGTGFLYYKEKEIDTFCGLGTVDILLSIYLTVFPEYR